jgi:hypothetical protein
MNPTPSLKDEIIHPSLKVPHIRQLGLEWWPSRQIMLEDEAAAGKRTLVHGTFYVFLEEIHHDRSHGTFWKGKPRLRTPPYLARYGIVYKTDHWIIRAVALPLGHPDTDIEPYQMEFVEEEWRKKMMGSLSFQKIEMDKKE